MVRSRVINESKKIFIIYYIYMVNRIANPELYKFYNSVANPQRCYTSFRNGLKYKKDFSIENMERLIMKKIKRCDSKVDEQGRECSFCTEYKTWINYYSWSTRCKDCQNKRRPVYKPISVVYK